MANDKEDSSAGKMKGKQKKDKTQSLLQTFLSESTIHGLQKLQEIQRKTRRYSWLALILLIWIFVSAHFYILLSSFIANETSIDLRIVDSRVLEFPAVTICNANPIKKSALEALAANNAQLEKLLALDDSESRRKRRRRRKRSLPTDTWVRLDEQGLEYYLSTSSKTYSDALEACKKIGTGMAKLLNEEMANAFLAALGPYLTDLNDIEEEGHFTHSDGSEPTWTKWCLVQPDNTYLSGIFLLSPADCTKFNGCGYYDTSCTYKGNYVCEKKVNHTYSVTTSEGGVYYQEGQSTVTEAQKEVKPSYTSTSAKPTTYVEKDISVTKNALKVSENDSRTPAYGKPTYINSTLFFTREQYFGRTTKPIPSAVSFQSDTTRTPDLLTEELSRKPTTRETNYETSTRLTDNAEDCGSSPCKHGGTCVTEEHGYSCLCTSNFHGVQCELGVPNDGGVSSTRTLELLTEDLAQNPTTPETNYETTTRLTDDAGDCASFPCKHGGTCITEEHGYSCLCTSNFHGVQCELGIPNDGGSTRTLELLTEDLASNPTTLETNYWTTSRLIDDADDCASSPCKHGGTCITEEHGYSCLCTSNFHGVQCELAIQKEGGEDIDFKKAEAVTTILSSLDHEERTRIGYQANDLLFSCRYSGRMCNISTSFTQTSNPFLGNCYTFNSKWQAQTTSRFLSTMSGRRHGLEIGINIGQKDMFKAAGGVAGAVIVIHSKDTMPFPADYGTVLTPGVYNAIRMQKIQISRLPYPYGDCIDEKSDASDRDVYISQYNVTYSKLGCQNTCHQRHVIDSCRCALSYYPRYGIPFGNTNVSLCDDNNEKQVACKAQIEMDLADKKLKCDCPNPCDEDIYIASKSSSQWPMLKRMESMISELKSVYPDLFNGVNEANIIRQNFLKAAIFYDDLSHEMVSEVPMYTGFQFAGDVGGMLGLWIGVSALGIVQLIEFALKAVYTIIVSRCTSKRRVANIEPTTSDGITM